MVAETEKGRLNRDVQKIKIQKCFMFPPDHTVVRKGTYFGSTRGMSICIRVKA